MKKTKIEDFVADSGEKAKRILGNAIHAVDQNDDGKFDFSDVASIAGAVGDAAKKGSRAVKETAGERNKMMELKSLQPIFVVTAEGAAFSVPKFIRVADRDKRHAESEVCRESIGYTSGQKGFQIVTLFRDSIDVLGLTFYPNCDYDFYYVDPSNKGCYIALDEYYHYLKIVRVNELKVIAQSLGAKHFKVTLQEERASSSEKKRKGHVTTGAATVGAEDCATEKRFSKIKIEAENEFPGHAPIMPKLKYWQGDPSIQTLVSMRMNERSPLGHEKYMLSLNRHSDIKVSDAVKIDTVMKGLKCMGNATVEGEARNESKKYLEYDIEF